MVGSGFLTSINLPCLGCFLLILLIQIRPMCIRGSCHFFILLIVLYNFSLNAISTLNTAERLSAFLYFPLLMHNLATNKIVSVSLIVLSFKLWCSEPSIPNNAFLSFIVIFVPVITNIVQFLSRSFQIFYNGKRSVQ